MKTQFNLLRTTIRILLTLTFLLIFTGCGKAYIKTQRSLPAEINVSQYDSIIIDDINGPYSKKLTSALKSEFFNNKHFTLIRNYVEDKNITFGISAEIINDNFSKEYDKGEGVCWDNKRKYSCILYNSSASWSATALIELTNKKTGEVFLQKRISKSHKESEKMASRYIKFDKNKGFNRVMKSIAFSFSRAIQPKTKKVKVFLFKGDEVVGFKQGVSFARKSDWVNAAKYFKKSVDFVKQGSVKAELASQAYYNYGISLGYSGINYDAAIESLNQASALYADIVYAKEIAKIERFKKESESLAKQGYK